MCYMVPPSKTPHTHPRFLGFYRVTLEGQLSVGLLDLGLCGIRLDLEDGSVI